MNRQPVVSNNKIIAFVAFLFAAIMTSVFVYHMSHKQVMPTIANGDATVFPEPRDIKTFELVSNQEIFTPQHLFKHWTLMIFGFTHCDNVCPATLDMLKRAYPTLRAQYPNLQVVFVSIDPEHDNSTKLTDYVHSFHPEFIGVSGKLKTVRTLQGQLGIYSAQEPGSEQIQHTSSILLLNPEGKWAAVFKYGMQPTQFVASVNESIKVLTPG